MLVQYPQVEAHVAGQAVWGHRTSFEVISEWNAKADLCTMIITSPTGKSAPLVHQGDPLRISWGYAGQKRTEIFRGVVRDCTQHSNALIVRGIDYHTVLHAKRIRTTFTDDTASGIIKALLAGTGLNIDIEACEVEVACLPLFNCTVRESVDAVIDIVRQETGLEYGCYIREGVFHWGGKKLDGKPMHAFRSSVDIITVERSSNGLIILQTMVVPVRSSEMITIDGARYFIRRANYTWSSGGRTTLWSERC